MGIASAKTRGCSPEIIISKHKHNTNTDTSPDSECSSAGAVLDTMLPVKCRCGEVRVNRWPQAAAPRSVLNQSDKDKTHTVAKTNKTLNSPSKQSSFPLINHNKGTDYGVTPP